MPNEILVFNPPSSGGITNDAPSNTVPKSNGTNLVSSRITDNGTTVVIPNVANIGTTHAEGTRVAYFGSTSGNTSGTVNINSINDMQVLSNALFIYAEDNGGNNTGSFNATNIFANNTNTTDTLSFVRGAHVEADTYGPASSLIAADTLIVNNGAGTVAVGVGLGISSAQNSGGGSITNNYGLKIEDQTAGVTNYAIKTGSGKVDLGDDLLVGGSRLSFSATVTAGGATGAQAINKSAGSINFAALDSSKVLNNSTVTADSIVIATVATNDATLKSVQAVAGSGIITFYGNAAATAETRINFFVITPQ